MDGLPRMPPAWRSCLVSFVMTKCIGAGEIEHAFRFTVRATNGYVYPASHRAGYNVRRAADGRALAAEGQSRHLRIPRPEMQKIFRAMKRYGLIVADNGSDLYVSGTFDTRWNNGILNPAFHALRGSDFEVVTLGYNPTLLPTAPTGLRIVPIPPLP